MEKGRRALGMQPVEEVRLEGDSERHLPTHFADGNAEAIVNSVMN